MTAEQDPRPRPQYGEYSDDAAVTPAANDSTNANASGEPADAAVDAPVVPTAQQPVVPPTASAPAADVVPGVPAAGPIPGVPHNLGVRGNTGAAPAAIPGVPAAPNPPTTPTAPAAPAQPSDPYRGQAPAGHVVQPAPEQQPGQAVQPGQQPAMFQPQPGSPYGAKKPRLADRIITVLLLVVGGYFALSMALSLSQLGLEFSKIADGLGLESYSPSPALKTTGTVGAILVLAIYALVLIFSIRRMRSGKLTFWAPLAAGVLAWIIFFVLFTVGLNQSPELWQELIRIASDPKATQELLDTLSTPSSN
ncbi:DUF6264 family protein [Leucobacter sp. UT-8R-CII-1-4]|uniref:DUF6264 family protein n=1 Tax=Leucobacter sp. UT-8R-CII-1-4 TaxID=3040075 RepID=UPI0024A9F464|nr:DUF6264 family protein [Leucobacter sp. UT-8R-CII-1-4]MDI6022320.1 DUF6264 family protein [Leucobacter sp. UT-8R-CII-1-4]